MGDSAKFMEADRLKLYKFIKILTLKVAQIVVQSRQGKKITQDYNSAIAAENGQQPNLQWVSVVLCLLSSKFYRLIKLWYHVLRKPQHVQRAIANFLLCCFVYCDM